MVDIKKSDRRYSIREDNNDDENDALENGKEIIAAYRGHDSSEDNVAMERNIL